MEDNVQLPSPEMLKYKILIKNRKNPNDQDNFPIASPNRTNNDGSRLKMGKKNKSEDYLTASFKNEYDLSNPSSRPHSCLSSNNIDFNFSKNSDNSTVDERENSDKAIEMDPVRTIYHNNRNSQFPTSTDTNEEFSKQTSNKSESTRQNTQTNNDSDTKETCGSSTVEIKVGNSRPMSVNYDLRNLKIFIENKLY